MEVMGCLVVFVNAIGTKTMFVEVVEPIPPPKKLRPFHLAFPVDDLQKAKQFYVDVLGCTTGREKEESVCSSSLVTKL